jgi:hypothetical protein
MGSGGFRGGVLHDEDLRRDAYPRRRAEAGIQGSQSETCDAGALDPRGDVLRFRLAARAKAGLSSPLFRFLFRGGEQGAATTA